MTAPETPRALVTGGNRGIGRAIAKGLRDLGMQVVIAARNPDDGAEAAAALGVDWIRLDLEKPRTFAAALKKAGRVDVLVNNAGILQDVPFLEQNDNFARSMQVMVHAPFELIRLLRPGMLDRRYGRIVNVSSEWGSFTEGLGGGGAYGIAKAALNALTVRAAQDTDRCVKVNAMCPGWVRTRMGGEAAQITPEEGADTAIWLATLPDSGPNGGFFRRRKRIAW